LNSLLTHFPDLANPIVVGWLALRVERWKQQARSAEPHKDASAAPKAGEG